jgi:chromosome segregation ATPase
MCHPRLAHSLRSCLAGMAFLVLASPALASDWPCVQRKVPEISLVSVWTGDPLDAVKDSWRSDRAVADLVDRLAARRTPLEEAAKSVSGFAAAAKKEQLLAAAAGLFEKLNTERSEIVAGIERYGRKQKSMAEAIRKLRDEVDKAKGDPDLYEELNDRFNVELRIFDERQKSLAYVCEVPTIIERRLFDISRKIQDAAVKKN